MSYFSPDFRQFLRELAANNDRDWFQANKKRYEKSVKKPFNDFVEEMIGRMRIEDDSIEIAPKDAIFRIHRDVRFSADKSPYKTHVSAVISPRGRKDTTHPGLYFQFGGDSIMLAGGAYQLDKDRLLKVRHYIMENMEEFAAAVEDSTFVNRWGEIRGERNKILPKEFRAAAEEQPLLFNKAFYYSAEPDAAFIDTDDLAEDLMAYYHDSASVRDFLLKALQS